jgi:hypothetical protein
MKKLAYKRNAGNYGENSIAYTNLADVELLNKLGFSVNPNEYLFLARGESPENIYAYIEKVAKIPESVSKAIDKDQAFSAEYLKELDYKVPDGYEIKGDLVVPIEKKAEEPLPSNFFKLSNGQIIDLNNVLTVFRTNHFDYDTYTSPSILKNVGLRHFIPSSGVIDAISHKRFLDERNKPLNIYTGEYSNKNITDFDRRPIRHIFYYHVPGDDKINLPNNFAEQLFNHIGGEEFFKNPDIYDNIDEENLRKKVTEHFKTKGFRGGQTEAEQYVFGPKKIKEISDEYFGRKTPPVKPTFFQKLKNYKKPIAIGAGLTGLAALGYYLNKRKNENAQQNKELDNRAIPHVTIETPSKTQDVNKRVKTQLDVVKKILNKTAAADHPLKSTNIKAVGYDKKEKTMDVEFHSGGTYRYNNVPKNLFDRIKRVKSPGKFFHKHIRKDNKFEYNKINLQEESL